MSCAASTPGTGGPPSVEGEKRSGCDLEDLHKASPRARKGMLATLPPRYGSPQEENVEGAPRQASRAARDSGSAPERVPDLPPAEAAASCLPELQDVQGPRHRAAHDAGAVMPRIAVDAMGGDRGPEEIVRGAFDARGEGIEPVIVGPPGLDTRGLE